MLLSYFLFWAQFLLLSSVVCLLVYVFFRFFFKPYLHAFERTEFSSEIEFYSSLCSVIDVSTANKEVEIDKSLFKFSKKRMFVQ